MLQTLDFRRRREAACYPRAACTSTSAEDGGGARSAGAEPPIPRRTHFAALRKISGKGRGWLVEGRLGRLAEFP